MKETLPYTLILASAGSGKTYRLTHHMLRQVHDGLVLGNNQDVVERILAATFTRAAAAEIIDRVLEILAVAVLDDKKRTDLSRELRGDEKLTAEVCSVMLQAVVRKMHKLQICTLDAFLIRAAQAFAPELGIAQPWSILNESSNQTVMFEAIDSILDEHADDEESRQLMLELLIMMNQKRHSLQVRQKLFDHLEKGYDAFQSGASDAWEVIDAGKQIGLEPAALKQCIKDLAVRLLPHVPLTQAQRPNANWVKAIATLAEHAAGERWDDLLDGGLLGAFFNGHPPTYSRATMPDAMIEMLQPLFDHCGAQLLSRLRERNIATRDLLTHFDLAYRNAKTVRSAWRFNDFTQLLVEAGVTAPERLDDFYFRLDGEFDHVLLDEFQDTSIMQWRMMQPLADEIISGNEGKTGLARSLLLVGDVKQTLYGWRNAEPRLLDELKTRWSQLQQQSLVTSYRSSQVVIDTVNTIFKSLLTNPALRGGGKDEYHTTAASVWAKWFESHTTVHKERSGFCRLSTCADGDDTAALQANAMRLAAQRVQQLQQQHPGADIAILVRRRKFIAMAMYELQRLEIPCSGEGGNPLTDDSAVCAALSLLHLIDHPSDSAALYHVGASPLGEAIHLKPDATISEVLSTTRKLRTSIMDRGLGSVLNEWLTLCADACSTRNFTRFSQLVELAHRHVFDSGELAPFLELVRQEKFEEAGTASVRVMTIHGSKGRQFKYVVLPDLDGDFIMSGPAGILVNRPQVLEPAACITYGPDKILAQLNSQLTAMSQESKARFVIEELCSLYVAITRAELGLEMIVHPQAPPKNGETQMPRSAAGVLRGVLAPGPCAGAQELWEETQIFPEPTVVIAPVAQESLNDAEPLVVALTSPLPGTSRTRPIVSPSAMEGGQYTSLAGSLSLDRATSLDRGTALHRLFEQIQWLSDPAPDPEQLRRAVADLGLSDEAFDELLKEFDLACKKPNIRQVLDQTQAAKRLSPGTTLDVWRERGFIVPMMIDNAESWVYGQLDRVVVARQNGKPVAAEIVDYKTDRIAPAHPDFADRVRHYVPQLAAYRKAVSRLLGLDPSAVSATLIFTESDRLVPLADQDAT